MSLTAEIVYLTNYRPANGHELCPIFGFHLFIMSSEGIFVCIALRDVGALGRPTLWAFDNRGHISHSVLWFAFPLEAPAPREISASSWQLL